MLQYNKVNIIIDGQFGSTGKGVFSSYTAAHNHVDFAITNSSPNAGHTFYIGSRKYIVKHLPVSGIINKRSTIYLCAGAIINPRILLDEIERYQVDPNRIFIHPRAAIISDDDIQAEHYGACVKLSSTQNGVGTALARKINREAKLARDIPEISHMVMDVDISYYLDKGCIALMEVPQGLGLSLNSGLEYPYCTSREITISQALSDLQIHPSYLGKVMVCIRTYPIRVGNLMDGEKEVGYSGPFYPDSKEMTWESLNLEKEYTTNTKRVRRVASFSDIQYKYMRNMLRPDYVFLNFCNYLTNMELHQLLDRLPEVTHIGFGKTMDDIRRIYHEDYKQNHRLL